MAIYDFIAFVVSSIELVIGLASVPYLDLLTYLFLELSLNYFRLIYPSSSLLT